MEKHSSKVPKLKNSSLRIRFTLMGLPAPHWREIDLHPSTDLKDLSSLIQLLFSLDRDLAWEFNIGEEDYRDPLLLKDFSDFDDATKYNLLMLREDEAYSFTYVYGLTESWRIKAEVVPNTEVPIDSNLPQFVAGEGASPPYRIGGVARYRRLLTILMDENHSKHDRLWVKYPYAMKKLSKKAVHRKIRNFVSWKDILIETEAFLEGFLTFVDDSVQEYIESDGSVKQGAKVGRKKKKIKHNEELYYYVSDISSRIEKDMAVTVPDKYIVTILKWVAFGSSGSFAKRFVLARSGMRKFQEHLKELTKASLETLYKNTSEGKESAQKRKLTRNTLN